MFIGLGQSSPDFVGLSYVLSPNSKIVTKLILDSLFGHMHCQFATLQAYSLGHEGG